MGLTGSTLAQDAAVRDEAAGGDRAASDVARLEAIWSPEWTLRFEPGVYLVGVSGVLTLAGGGGGVSFSDGEFDLTDDLNLDDPTLQPFGELHYRRGRLRITASGFSASNESDAVLGGQPTLLPITSLGEAPVFGGDVVKSDLRFVSGELNVGWRVLGGRAGYEDQLGYGVDVFGGVRVHSVSFDGRIVPAALSGRSASDPLATEADELFAEPIVGGRLELELYENFGMDLATSIGGFTTGERSSFSYDIQTGFWAEPTPGFSVQVGFRLLIVRLEGEDDFEWEGSAAGLYWGVGLSF